MIIIFEEVLHNNNHQTTDTMRRSNSKEVKNLIKQHIIDCVYDEEGEEFNTFEQAGKQLVKEFKRTADHENNKRRLPNHQERFSDWMWGLPYHFEYMNHEIRKTLNEWLQHPNPEKFSDTEAGERYHALIWREVKNFYYELD